jgi:hypothetical protein
MHWVNRPTTQQLAMFGRKATARALAGQPRCRASSAYRSLRVIPRGRGLAFRFRRASAAPVAIDVIRARGGRRVARFTGRRAGFAWRARRLPRGSYVVRVASRAPNGTTDVRRIPVRLIGGRFRRAAAIERHRPCGLLRAFAIRHSTFGRRPLRVAFAVGRRATVTLALRRNGRVVRRVPVRIYAPGRTHRVTLRGLPRGRYRVTVSVRAGAKRVRASLRASRT